ncbi:hypothetical protein QU896_29335, partial [Citrobacter freundii]|uniref:hypothetical protein n=1 Tax=Citrobacter freundii TaxID=546 RepID=UPI0038C1A3D7
LDGTTGKITAPITGCRERAKDIRMVLFSNNHTPIPILAQGVNPYKLSGTMPRYLEPLSVSGDPTGEYLFRIWPLTATTTTAMPLR